MTPPLTLVGGSVFVGGRFLRADVNVEHGAIAAIGDGLERHAEVVDCSDRYIVPGLIDLQAIGGGLRTFSANVDEPSYEAIARAHAATGTTALCVTVVSGPPEQMLDAVALAATLCEKDIPSGSAVVGIHIDGPFLSQQQRGRHAAQHLRAPSLELSQKLRAAGRGWVRLVTLAPELDGALPVIRYLTQNGVRVMAGHTDAGADAMYAAMGQGLAGVTQLFNDMPPLAGGAPGPAGVVFASSLFAGIVGDLAHVNREALAAVVRSRLPGRTYLTTAASALLGTSVHSHEVAGETLTANDGACFTLDGRLEGSVTPLSHQVRILIRDLEVPVDEAVAMASAVPASILGLRDRGEIRPGGLADLLVIQRHRVDAIILRGSLLEAFPNYRRL